MVRTDGRLDGPTRGRLGWLDDERLLTKIRRTWVSVRRSGIGSADCLHRTNEVGEHSHPHVHAPTSHSHAKRIRRAPPTLTRRQVTERVRRQVMQQQRSRVPFEVGSVQRGRPGVGSEELGVREEVDGLAGRWRR